ncbi:hypothetical protein Nepgr_029773 [Nepenthes gracilis]|uniref:Uncharacterized protein n=1 Tax=Nepenthes gracilis TaxID=150966 RepID=A0AAD3Y562_NEPGR|nr:hypothetical protein Nepgr_029773 [Nepenthes gracilis]
MMKNFGCIDLLLSNDIWDPSAVFEEDHGEEGHYQQSTLELQQEALFQHEQVQPSLPQGADHDHQQVIPQGRKTIGQENFIIDDDGGGVSCRQSTERPDSEDLAMVFFEWLKSIKESISAEDLRNIKIKKSTIKCAAKRLGGGKEGMTQLLKLILQWVQNHQINTRAKQQQLQELTAPSTISIAKQSKTQIQTPEILTLTSILTALLIILPQLN